MNIECVICNIIIEYTGLDNLECPLCSGIVFIYDSD